MHLFNTVETKRKLCFYLTAFLFYLCLNLFYINIDQDMGPENYLTYALPTILALYFLQYFLQKNMLSLQLLSHLVTGLLWCVTFPLLYTWTYDSTWYISKIRIDLLLGTGIFISLTGLQMLFLQMHVGERLTSIIFTMLDLVCMLIPALQIAYYLLYQHCLTPATLMALYLTNPRESIDFLQNNIDIYIICLTAIGICLLFYIMYKGNKRLSQTIRAISFSRKGKYGFYSLTIIVVFYSAVFLFPHASIVENWQSVSDYVNKEQRYTLNYAERFNDMHLDDESATLPKKAPGTVIMVIGESASRNYMKAYTPSFPYDDTPWLGQRKSGNNNFIVFDNAYSSWVQTVPSLQRALTEQSQYNDKEFYDSLSVLDVAKKAGYDTYWFSNQGRYGEYDSAVTLIAKTADHAKWTDDSYVFTERVDSSLLNFLPQVDANKNNFIVLHLMGSHIYYNNRYPAEFAKWTEKDGNSTVTSYADSIFYTDYMLGQIYDYAKKNLHLQAMIYYSDHGEDVNISHNPDVFQFDMVRIPMFVYLSDEYQSVYPEQTSVLKHNQKQFFTNDLIYDTVCGILNAPSNHYDQGQDFSSSQYRFNVDNLTTMLGEKKISEDPYINQ